jgi:hypothetical protein
LCSLQSVAPIKLESSSITANHHYKKRHFHESTILDVEESQSKLKYQIVSKQDDRSETRNISRRALSTSVKIDSLFRLTIHSKETVQANIHLQHHSVENESQSMEPSNFSAVIMDSSPIPDQEPETIANDSIEQFTQQSQIVHTPDKDDEEIKSQPADNDLMNESVHIFQSPPPHAVQTQQRQQPNIAQNTCTIYFINTQSYDLKKNRDETTLRIKQAIQSFENRTIGFNSRLRISPLVISSDQPLDRSITQYYVKRSYHIRHLLGNVTTSDSNKSKHVVFHDPLNALEYNFITTLGKGSYGFAVLSQLNYHRSKDKSAQIAMKKKDWMDEKMVVLKIGFDAASIQFEVLMHQQFLFYLNQMNKDEYIDRYHRHFFPPYACYTTANTSIIVMQYAELG